MSILNIVLYIMMFYFIFRLFSTSKRNGKGKQLIDIVASINHHDEFFEGINDMIANCGDPVYENKARVIFTFTKKRARTVSAIPINPPINSVS